MRLDTFFPSFILSFFLFVWQLWKSNFSHSFKRMWPWKDTGMQVRSHKMQVESQGRATLTDMDVTCLFYARSCLTACRLHPVPSRCSAIYRNYSLFRQYYGSFGLSSTNRWQIARHFLINFNSSINPQRKPAERRVVRHVARHVMSEANSREGEVQRGGARWAAAKENFFYFVNWPETYK